MTVYRPTASCISSIFPTCGKKHILVTGGRSAGKTTLLSKLLPDQKAGITTRAEKGVGVYFEDNSTGNVVQMGVFDPSTPLGENRMVPIPAAFKEFCIPTLQKLSESPSEWVSIDEIGYLECSCPEYLDALDQIFEKKRVLAAVRKQELPYLQALLCRADAFVIDLDEPFGDIDCVIMASGLGKRFGSNKLLADFGSEPMICRILSATEGIFKNRVVVTRSYEVAELCRARGIETVLHDLPYRSDTVRLGLEALGGASRCMFCSADQPLLSRETVAALALASLGDGKHIWRAAYSGAAASPVVFPFRFFEELCNLPEGKGGGAVIQRHPEAVRLVNVSSPLELEDADTPEDLERLRKALI